MLEIRLGGNNLIRRKKIPVYKKPWSALSPRQKMFRKRSLEVLAKSRKSSKSLSKIAKQFGMSVKTVINNTNAFKKINRKWIPKKFDKISRSMVLSEGGKMKSIETSDSRHARTIGQYDNAVGYYLSTGDSAKLEKFSKRKIKDSDGKVHSFETRLKTVQEIHKRIEEIEFFEVYDS